MMSSQSGFTGVSNCYVFKSRLQEYAQKAGISTPVYETVKEGPSHEPSFRSTVIVNNVRYDSLTGFFNRKAAEQSAAEIAFLEILKSGNMSECVPHPVHETGLCKNLLQEYSQKMNYAIPSYITVKQATAGKLSFSCTVEIGGIQYIGAAAKTKKEAEIKAARTALLAIQANSSPSLMNLEGGSVYTVQPCKKKGKDSEVRTDAVKPLKPKKANFKKRCCKRKFNRNKGNRSKTNPNQQENALGAPTDALGMSEANTNCQDEQIQGLKHKQSEEGYANIGASTFPSFANEGYLEIQHEGSDFSHNWQEISNMKVISHMHVEGVRIPQTVSSKFFEDAQTMAQGFHANGQGVCKEITSSLCENNISVRAGALMVVSSNLGVPKGLDGFENHLISNQIEERKNANLEYEQAHFSVNGHIPMGL